MNNSGTDMARLKIDKQARDWLAITHSDVATREEREHFFQWLDADPRHVQAYTEIDTVWQDIGQLTGLRDIEPLQAAENLSFGKRFLSGIRNCLHGLTAKPAAAFSAVAVVVVVAAVVVFDPMGTGSADVAASEYSTGVAGIREIALEDGSVVTLGAKTRLKVTFDDDKRTVFLAAGEAFFSVAKDPVRPFMVTAGKARITVIGTEFDVRHAARKVHIAVLEGNVNVTSPASSESVEGQAKNSIGRLPANSHNLVAGQQVIASPDGELSAVTSVNTAQLGAWRTGRLVYDNASLSTVVADAERYYEGRIILATEDLYDLSVTAGFRTDQIEAMLNGLVITHDLTVQHQGRDIVINKRQ